MNLVRIQTYIFIVLGITSAVLWVNIFYRESADESMDIADTAPSPIPVKSTTVATEIKTESMHLNTPEPKPTPAIQEPTLKTDLSPSIEIEKPKPLKSENPNQPVRKLSKRTGNLTIKNNKNLRISFKVMSAQSGAFKKEGMIQPDGIQKIPNLRYGEYTILISDSANKSPIIEVKRTIMDETGAVFHVN